jgi:hypothetical protein
MNKLLLLVPAALLVLSACGSKSYTYEAFLDIEGTGFADVTIKTPANKAGTTEALELPVKGRGIFIEGLGAVSVEAKSSSGALTCTLKLEKESPVKNSGDPAKCETTITEDTDN